MLTFLTEDPKHHHWPSVIMYVVEEQQHIGIQHNPEDKPCQAIEKALGSPMLQKSSQVDQCR
jgi:hypothetical protein